MGSSSISQTSNRITAKKLSGTGGFQAGDNIETADILPEETEEGIVIALVNITSAFAQQKVGTPITVRNRQVFTKGTRLGDIPSAKWSIVKSSTRGHVHSIEEGSVYLIL